jgi:MtN3 and saliva related transmembrane protein
MTLKTVIGFLATVVTIVILWPQIYRIYKLKHTKDLSLPTYVLLATAGLLWVIYGVIIKDLAIIITNTLTLTASLIVVFYKLKLG